MTIMQAFKKYLFDQKIDMKELAEKMQMEESEVIRVIFQDEDMYMSELDRFLEALEITAGELFAGSIDRSPITVDDSINVLMESLNDEEKALLEELMEVFDNLEGNGAHAKKIYYN